MRPLPLLATGTLMQIGILVPDLDEALARHSAAFGLGPWIGYRFTPDTVRDFTYRGKPADYSIDIAMTGTGPQMELVQVHGENSLYQEFLDRHGYGVQHLGVKVADAESTTAELVAAGYEVLQSGHGYGRDGDGRFAYFDTVADFGWLLEIIEPPAVRREPDFVWPSLILAASVPRREDHGGRPHGHLHQRRAVPRHRPRRRPAAAQARSRRRLPARADLLRPADDQHGLPRRGGRPAARPPRGVRRLRGDRGAVGIVRGCGAPPAPARGTAVRGSRPGPRGRRRHPRCTSCPSTSSTCWGSIDVGAYFPHRVTYHPTCHSLRMLRVGDRPSRLLRAVRGLDLVELPEADGVLRVRRHVRREEPRRLGRHG